METTIIRVDLSSARFPPSTVVIEKERAGACAYGYSGLHKGGMIGIHFPNPLRHQ